VLDGDVDSVAADEQGMVVTGLRFLRFFFKIVR
jgi:hypothetical protein